MILEYILKRLAVMVPVLLLGSIITFVLVFLAPGDIGVMMADVEASAMGVMATPEMVEAIFQYFSTIIHEILFGLSRICSDSKNSRRNIN